MVRKITALGAAAVALSVALSGCGESGSRKGGADGRSLKIGLALYNQLQPRWLFDARAFEAQAKKNGDTVITQFADTDPTRQTQQVQSMMARGIDVLVIASADIGVGANLIEAAKRQGIKTIVYDIGVKDAAADWMIVRNQRQVGTLQVEAALQSAPKGNYAVLKGDAGNDLAQVSSEVYAKLLQGKPGIKVVYNDFIKGFDPTIAQRTAEDILTRNRDQIAAFLVNNDGMATGVAQAVRGAQGAGKVFISGLDADQANLHAIATGVQTMTVFTPIDVMARTAADAAHDLGNDRKPKFDRMVKTAKGNVPAREVELIKVDKSNLCEFVTKIAPQGWADPKVVFEGSDIKC